MNSSELRGLATPRVAANASRDLVGGEVLSARRYTRSASERTARTSIMLPEVNRLPPRRRPHLGEEDVDQEHASVPDHEVRRA